MAPPASLWLQAPGANIRIDWPGSHISRAIEPILRSWLQPIDPCPERPHLCFQFEPLALASGIRLLCNGAELAAGEDLFWLFNWLQQTLDEAFLESLTHRTAIHAGAVAHAGRAILLPALSGAGKSTLVRELLRHGASYLSDEFAVIGENGLVHPYPRPLMPRNAKGEQRPVLPAELNAPIAAGPAPAGLVLFAAYAPDAVAPLNVAPLSRGDGLLRLLQNTPQALAERPSIFAPIAALSSQAHFFSGVRGEAAAAARAILRLAEANS